MKKQAVITISSHVVRGSVGNRAAAFALEVMGHPTWVVPTVTLPWHPGHGPGTRLTPASDDFNTMLNELGNAPWLDEVGAVLSGYMGNAGQVEAVAQLVARVKAQNPDAIYALDPVIGDGERLYVPEETAIALRDHLLPLADIVTPNRFELGWLSDAARLERNEHILDAARSLGTRTVLVTSAEAMMRDHIGNLMVHDNKAWLAEHRFMKGPPNGLGDLTSAVMLANWLGKGTAGPEMVLARTTASIYEVMAIAAKAGADELMLECAAESLLRPRTKIEARSLQVTKL